MIPLLTGNGVATLVQLEREKRGRESAQAGVGVFDLVKRGLFRRGVVFHRINLSCLLLMRNRRAPQREKFLCHLARNEGSYTFCIFKHRSSSVCQSCPSKAGDTAAVVMDCPLEGASQTAWPTSTDPEPFPLRHSPLPSLFTSTLQAPDDCCGSCVGGPPSVS